jgi:hypothetical protein
MSAARRDRSRVVRECRADSAAGPVASSTAALRRPPGRVVVAASDDLRGEERPATALGGHHRRQAVGEAATVRSWLTTFLGPV